MGDSRTIPARDVVEGMNLVGLSNGYVFESEPEPEVSLQDGRFAFNDERGEENYLVVLADHPIEVST